MKTLTKVFLLAIMATNLFGFSGGLGTDSNPYLISTATDLQSINTDLSASYILTNNIDLSGLTFTGAVVAPETTGSTSEFNSPAFTGTFDGNGKKITSLTINAGDAFIGLFGMIESTGIVKNLQIDGLAISVNNAVLIGGIAGESNGQIFNCGVSGSINGGRYPMLMGGIVGYNNGIVANSFSTATITGDYLGGFVGICDASSEITNCYTTGAVAGGELQAAFCSENLGIITNCFWNNETSGQTSGTPDSINETGLTGLTTSEMQTQSSYAGWNFTDVWEFTAENTYPTLKIFSGYGAAVIVPNLSSLTYNQAINIIEELDLTLGEVSYVFSSEIEIDSVVSQSIAAGTVNPESTIINISISLGESFPGEGTEQSPYLISTPEDLLKLRTCTPCFSAYFQLENDISMSQYMLSSSLIASNTGDDSEFSGVEFTGVFNGNGHIISGLTISSTSGYLGLFGKIGASGVVSQLGLEDVSITGNNAVMVGSIAAENEGTISLCYSTGNINAGNFAMCIGGIVGFNAAEIANCYSSINVTGDYVGGIVGFNDAPNGIVTNCYANGSVRGNECEGAIAGENYNTISNCLWDTELTTMTSGYGINEGSFDATGKTTEEMELQSTYSSIGWDMTNDWTMPFYGGSALIKIFVLNADPIVVPNLIGLTIAEATDALTDAELNLSTVSYEYNADVATGLVFAQFPDAQTINPQTNEVTITISLGKELIGDGTPEFPYEISTADEFIDVLADEANHDKHFIFTANINLATYNFNMAPIAKDTDTTTAGFQGTEFTGTIDGQGHVITDLKINTNSNGADCLGLIGSLGTGASITNIGVECFIDGDSGSYSIGGLCGINNGVVSNCYTKGSIDGNYDIGGVVGRNYGTVSNCYSTASLAGTYIIGGIVGRNYSSIDKCYASSLIAASYLTGGVCSYNSGGTVTNSFWDKEATGVATSQGGTGKTTAEMQTIETFTNAGWDFAGEILNGIEDVWNICDSYPEMSWQKDCKDADFNKDGRVDVCDESIILSQEGISGVNSCDFAPADGTVDQADLDNFYIVFNAEQAELLSMGDANKDYHVDQEDFIIFIENWLSDNQELDIAPSGKDGIVNYSDLAEMLLHYGTSLD